eukprot:404152-Amphidinium_carterae.1
MTDRLQLTSCPRRDTQTQKSQQPDKPVQKRVSRLRGFGGPENPRPEALAKAVRTAVLTHIDASAPLRELVSTN